MKICMFVTNNCKYDSRVLKEAKTLTDAGHDVRIIATLDKDTEPYEEKDGFRIIRVTRDPVHYRFLRLAKKRPVLLLAIAQIFQPVRLVYRRLRRPLGLAFGLVGRFLGSASGWTRRPFELAYRWVRRPLRLAYRWVRQPLRLTFRRVRRPLRLTYRLVRRPLRLAFRRIRRPLRLAYRRVRRLLRLAYRRVRRPLRLAYRRVRRPLRLTYRRVRRPLRLAYRRVRRPLRLAYRRVRRPLRLAYRHVQQYFYLRLRAFLLVFHRPLSLIDYYRRSWQAIKDEPADVYHSHDLTTLPIGYIAKRKTGGRLVYDSHELFTEVSGLRSLERLIFKLMERYLIRRAERVITVNNSIAEQLSKRYGVELPQVVMNCPPLGDQEKPTPANSLRQKFGLPDGIPIILYHGGFSPGRGLHNLILAASYLNEGKIVFMGWGKLEQELKDLVRDKGLADIVLFTEPVLPNQVAGQVAAANIGVPLAQNTCLNNYYSISNKFFDYVRAGLPVVTSGFPELKRIVEGYHLGKICDPEDPRDIAAAINWVLSDKDRYEEMRKNALEAAKIFNWENESKKLLDVYEKLESNQDGSAA